MDTPETRYNASKSSGMESVQTIPFNSFCEGKLAL
jgi:hypothetical protein